MECVVFVGKVSFSGGGSGTRNSPRGTNLRVPWFRVVVSSPGDLKNIFRYPLTVVPAFDSGLCGDSSYLTLQWVTISVVC